MHFEVENIEGVRVVMFRVLELNHSNSAAIKKSLAATVDFEQPAVINLDSVEHVDTSGLSLIIHWLAESRRLGERVVLCSGSPRFRALIELVRIPSFATLYPTLPDALEACWGPSTVRSNGDQSAPAAVSRPRAAAVGRA
jgi:anti-anti-sigma factor